MSQQVDLNQLRETILDNQRRGDILPASMDEKIFVDRHGKIVPGDEVSSAEQRELSEVQQGVFAGMSGRLSRDQQVVAVKFPRDTEFLEIDGVSGWLYSFEDELDESYTMFLYFDGSAYQVKVVEPEVENRYSPHRGHLFSDGRICFHSGSGLPSLEQAYAKSVLWATGFTSFRHTGTFPFSVNNL